MAGSSIPTSNVGLVLAGHGSEFSSYKENVNELAAIIRERSLFMTVRVGFMEIMSPTIHDAMSNAVEEGAEKLIVVPVLLANGRHTTEDIPKLLGMKKGQNRGTFSSKSRGNVEVAYCKPIGADKRLAEIILDRATEALKDPGLGTTAELTSNSTHVLEKWEAALEKSSRAKARE